MAMGDMAFGRPLLRFPKADMTREISERVGVPLFPRWRFRWRFDLSRFAFIVTWRIAPT
jgi:hypothetical protein